MHSGGFKLTKLTCYTRLGDNLIRHVATGCTGVTLTKTLLSNAADIAPPIRRKQVPRGWCATEATKAELHARWQDREDARKRVRSAPNDRGLRQVLMATAKQLKRTRAEAVQRFFEDFVSQLEGRMREGDRFGFYKHLKEMDVEGKRTFKSQYIKDEAGRLLRDNALIRERWVRWFYKLLNTKSPTLDPSIVDELKQWPPCRPLDDVPSRYELEGAICALANRKAVSPDGLPAELLKVLADEGEIPSGGSTISSSVCGGEVAYRNNGKMQRLRFFTRRKIGLSVAIIVASPLWFTAAKYSSKSSRVA